MLKLKWGYLLFIFLTAAFLYPVSILEVKSERSNQIFIRKCVSPGDRFEFKYIHSVEKIQISGFFLITSGGMIKPVETHFPSYGPGLPFMKEEVVLEKGMMKTRSEAEDLKQFSFFVSRMTKQFLVFKDKKIDFSSAKEGEIIKVKVKRYPLLGVFLKHGS